MDGWLRIHPAPLCRNDGIEAYDVNGLENLLEAVRNAAILNTSPDNAAALAN